MKKSIFAISIITAVIIFFLIGYWVGQTPIGQPLDKAIIVQETKNNIKNRLVEARIINPEPEKVLSISGNVINVGKNYLLVSPSIKQDPFGEIFPQQVKILIDENTKIEKWTLKNPAEYEEEKDQDPSPYNKETAQLKDVNLDYYILLAKSENDIKGLHEFTATEINFSIKNPLEG